jgi:hypothetical protein
VQVPENEKPNFFITLSRFQEEATTRDLQRQQTSKLACSTEQFIVTLQQ